MRLFVFFKQEVVILTECSEKKISNFGWARGVVVSRVLRKHKAPGSIPGASTLFVLFLASIDVLSTPVMMFWSGRVTIETQSQLLKSAWNCSVGKRIVHNRNR